ncbi:MAG: 3-hydroxyacyl-CoA dehydrogenase NAD-binding domain-containing protein [Rhodospirillaceae bacterium]
MTAVQREISGDVAVLRVANPPVNALSQDVRQGLIDGIHWANGEAAIKAIVIIGNGGFIAGADLREQGTPPPILPDVISTIESSVKPVVAAIEGQALGGGVEIALASHYRLADAKAQFGTPEIKLGIVPGSGATQKLPRLIDPQLAFEMITTGKIIDAKTALKSGLIDRIVDTDVLAAAIARARAVVGEDLDARRLSRWPAPDGAAVAAALAAVEPAAKKQRPLGAAPAKALALLASSLAKPFAEGLAEERAAFLSMKESPEGRALRHMFLAERAAKKLEGPAADAKPRKIAKVGIIGAGTMGTGIAITFADAGYPVTLIEMSEEALNRGLDRVKQNYEGSVKQGRLTREGADERIARVTGSVDYTALADADLIIEAAFESMAVKHDIFKALDKVAKAGAILATNTSYLDIDAIAAVTSRPADVVGLHYFSPANIMKLLEVVDAKATAPDVLATAMSVASRTGKIPVVAGVCHGFIGNRMLRAYNREAGLLLLEGATPAQVDKALRGFGMAMGPFAVADLSGIDIGYKARKEMPEGSFEPKAFAVHTALVEAGHLGQKTGSGFYKYEKDAKDPAPNPLVDELLAKARTAAGVTPRDVTADEIVSRTIFALVAEGAHILEEGIAQRASDIDVAYVNGYGFPRYRGGPMFHAELTGWPKVIDFIRAQGQGPFAKWWTPSKWLLKQV